MTLFMDCGLARGGGRSRGCDRRARLGHEASSLGVSPLTAETRGFVDLLSDGFIRVIREHGSEGANLIVAGDGSGLNLRADQQEQRHGDA
jgi:hypothetical protein